MRKWWEDKAASKRKCVGYTKQSSGKDTFACPKFRFHSKTHFRIMVVGSKNENTTSIPGAHNTFKSQSWVLHLFSKL